MAKFIRKRDRGICAICGLDCEALKKRARILVGKDRLALMDEHGIPHHRSRFWDIDHIVPVVEGGGDSGPENLRTVCIKCHKKVTAELAAKRALERKAAKSEA